MRPGRLFLYISASSAADYLFPADQCRLEGEEWRSAVADGGGGW